MAAAPELYNALEAALKQLKILVPEAGMVHDERMAIVDAEIALQKARGEFLK